MTATRTLTSSLTALAALGALTTTTACSGSDDAGGDRATGVDPDWYSTVHSAAAKAKKAGHLGSTPYLDADDECEVADEVGVGGSGTEGVLAAGSATAGDSGLRYVCEFHDPSVTLSVLQFDDADELAEAKASAYAQDNSQNEQVDHTYRVGKRSIIVNRTTYPTNDSHVDYQAVYVDTKHRGAVVVQIETTGKQMKTYTAKRAAHDLGDLLSSS